VRRFWISPEDISDGGATVTLSGDEFHHLSHVARLGEGERLELLTGDGRIATGEILSITKKNAEIKILSVNRLPPPPEPRVSLILSVPRFQKMDLILQKCVELGCHEMIPVVSEKSFVKTINSDLKGKIPRWKKIILEACKQSGRAWPMEIREPQKLSHEVARIQSSSDQAGLFLYEGEGVVDIKSALHKIRQGGALRSIACFVGAEGGFSPQEVGFFGDAGFHSVTMGPLVLRVETACIALLGVIQYEFDYMR